MTNKPHTNNTMMLSIIDKNDNCKTLILPLTHVRVQQVGVEKYLYILTKPIKEISEHINNVKNIVLSVNNDPYKSWAGDWTQLGCFEIRWVMRNCKFNKENKNEIEFIGTEYNCINNLPGRDEKK